MIIYPRIAGIEYEVEVDVEEEYVCDVLSVSVYDGETYHELSLNEKSLEDFYNSYEDFLNEAYHDHKIALAETFYE